MTTVTIDLPDDRAALLAERAAKLGLSLADWFQKIAEQEEQTSKRRYTLTELLDQCDPEAPLAAEDLEWLNAPAVGHRA